MSPRVCIKIHSSSGSSRHFGSRGLSAKPCSDCSSRDTFVLRCEKKPIHKLVPPCDGQLPERLMAIEAETATFIIMDFTLHSHSRRATGEPPVREGSRHPNEDGYFRKVTWDELIIAQG